MDDYLKQAINDAWERVRPKLERDPDALAARLARRRMGLMRSPPRAWCLAVRACDTRITPWKFLLTPTRPVFWDEESHCWRYHEHKVLLTAKDLRWLCQPVTIPWPGADASIVARMLGVHPQSVWRAAKRGQFSCRHIRGLSGKHCDVPVVYTRSILDPAGVPLGTMADPVWGTSWRYVSEHVPDDVNQAVLRRPVFREHHGRPQFDGWRWVCPGCGRNVTRIFYPLPPLELANFVKPHDDGSPEALESPAPCFACKTCHRIRYQYPTAKGWNHLITHLTGGLLLGREVPKPPGYTLHQRKHAFHPRPNRAPSVRIAQVLPLLLNTTMDRFQIARMLKITPGSVCGVISTVYKRYNIHSREDLRKAIASQSAESPAAKAAG